MASFTNTMRFLLMLTLTPMIHGKKYGEFVKISNAVVFKPLERNYVYYESSLPMLYKEKFEVTEEEIVEYADIAFWTEANTCTDNEKTCALLEETSKRSECMQSKAAKKNCTSGDADLETNVIRKTKELMKEELRAAIFEMRQELQTDNRKIRTKRGLNFLGKIFSFCCDVVLEEQLAPVGENVERLSTRYSRLRDSVIENHRGLFAFEAEMNGLGQKVADALKEVRQTVGQQRARTELREAIAHQFELLILHYRDITKYCHSSLIPVNVVKPTLLKKDLIRMQTELEKHGKTLAIDVDRVNEYYKLPIASCQLLQDEISVLLKVPVKQMNTAYQLFEVIALPFTFEDEICQLRSQKSLVLHEKTTDEVKILTGQALEKCNGVHRLCAIVPPIQDENSMCLKKVYRREPTDVIKRSCNFECRGKLGLESNSEDGVLPIINTIAYREYVITKPSGMTLVQYENKTRTQLEWSSDNIGAFHLHLSCTSKLIQKLNDSEIILIDSELPCFSNGATAETAKITRILPSAWCRLPDSVIEDMLDARNEYKITKELINSDWKREIPTVRVQTDIEVQKKMNEMVFAKMNEIAPQNPFQNSVIVIILVIGAIALVGLIYGVIVVHREFSKIKKTLESSQKGSASKCDHWGADWNALEEVNLEQPKENENLVEGYSSTWNTTQHEDENW